MLSLKDSETLVKYGRGSSIPWWAFIVIIAVVAVLLTMCMCSVQVDKEEWGGKNGTRWSNIMDSLERGYVET